MRVWQVLGLVLGGVEARYGRGKGDAIDGLVDAYANRKGALRHPDSAAERAAAAEQTGGRRRAPGGKLIVTPLVQTLLDIEKVLKQLDNPTFWSGEDSAKNLKLWKTLVESKYLPRKMVIGKGWQQAILQEVKELQRMSLTLGLGGEHDMMDQRQRSFEDQTRRTMDNVERILREWDTAITAEKDKTEDAYKGDLEWWRELEDLMHGNVTQGKEFVRTIRTAEKNYKKDLSANIVDLNDLLEDARKDANRIFDVWKNDAKKQVEIGHSLVKGQLMKAERVRKAIANEGVSVEKENDKLEKEIYDHVSKMHNRMETDAEEWDHKAQTSIESTNRKYGDGGILVARDLMLKSEDEIGNKAIDEENAIELKSKKLRRTLDEQFRHLQTQIDKVRNMDKLARRGMLDKRGQIKDDAEQNLRSEAAVTGKLLALSTVRAQLLANARKVASAATVKEAEEKMRTLSKDLYANLADAGEEFNETSTKFMENVSRLEKRSEGIAQDLIAGKEDRVTQVDTMNASAALSDTKLEEAVTGTTAIHKELRYMLENISKDVADDHEEYMGELDGRRTAARQLTANLTQDTTELEGDVAKHLAAIDDQFRLTVHTVPKLVEAFTAQDAAQVQKLQELKDANAQTIRAQLAMVQKVNERTGFVTNGLLPAAKAYGETRGRHVQAKINALEDYLRQRTGEIVALAADGSARGEQLQLHASKTGTQMIQSLRTTEADEFQAAQELDHKVEEVAEETGDKTSPVLTGATETLKRAGQTEAKVKHLAAAPGKRLSAGEEQLQQARKTAQLRFERAAEKTRVDVEKHLASTAQSTYRGWDGQRDALARGVEYAAASGIGVPLGKFRKAESAAEEAEHSVADGVARGHSAVQRFEQNLRGRAANSSDWSARVAANLSAEAAEGHRSAVLAAESMAAQQAAIDRRFREVAAAVDTDQGVLHTEVEQARNHVVAQAKAMYERVARTEALSAEQKAVRLKEIDAWMQSAMGEVADRTREDREDLELAKENGVGVMDNAKAQAAKLLERMEALDQQQGVAMGTDEGVLSLELLFEDLEGTVGRLKDDGLKRWARWSDTHTRQAEGMRSEHEKAQKGTDRILEGLTKTLGQLVARQQTQEAQTRDDLNSEASDRQSLLDRANARLAIQREALAAQVGERASRFRALREWMGTQKGGEAGALERATRTLSLLTRTASDRLIARKAATEKRAERMQGVEQEPHLAVGALAKAANETLEKTAKERDAWMSWIATYENQTAEWRGAVTEALDKLATEMAHAEADVSAGSKRVAAAVHYAEGAATSQIRSAVAHSLEANNARYASAAASMEGSMAAAGKVVAGDAARGAQAASRLAAEAAAGLRTAGVGSDTIRAASADTDAEAERVRVVQANAFQSTNAVLAAQQAELDSARDRLHAKLDDVHDALSPGSMLELDSSDIADLTANAALNAEHSQLAAEVAKLKTHSV